MDKKEKYINYVVNKLVTQTKIDYDQGKILPPFYSSFSLYLFIPPYSYSTLLPIKFSKHVIERYGIHDNDVDNTWKLYKGKIKEVIDNG